MVKILSAVLSDGVAAVETAVLRLGDVHVHADMVLAGNHFRRTAPPLGDPCVIERRDDALLAQRAGSFTAAA